MTTDWRETATCGTCGATVNTEPLIKRWIRGNKNLDSQDECLYIGDSDLWVHKWGVRSTRWPGVSRAVQHLMLVEIKTHDRALDKPQRDHLHLINQLLRTHPWKEDRDKGRFVPGHVQNNRVAYGYLAGRKVTVYSHGVHVLRLTGATPVKSDAMTWDTKDITGSQLEELLRFELNPDSLRLDDRRSHKRRVRQLTLLENEGESAA